MPLPRSALKLLGIDDATYQIVDVNPGFNDSSSEIILVLKAGPSTYQYSLDFPKGQRVQAVLGFPMKPDARIVPYKRGIALLECFFGPAKGAYLITLPLGSENKLHLVRVNEQAFEDIALQFKSLAVDPTVKEQFCKGDLQFAAYFEKYAGSCGWSPAEYATNSSVHNYDSFWMNPH